MKHEIVCLQDGCGNLFTIKRLEELKVPDTLITKFKQINQDFQVTTSANRKYCPMPDCD
jgi:hypothetical protein